MERVRKSVRIRSRVDTILTEDAALLMLICSYNVYKIVAFQICLRGFPSIVQQLQRVTSRKLFEASIS